QERASGKIKFAADGVGQQQSLHGGGKGTFAVLIGEIYLGGNLFQGDFQLIDVDRSRHAQLGHCAVGGGEVELIYRIGLGRCGQLDIDVSPGGGNTLGGFAVFIDDL